MADGRALLVCVGSDALSETVVSDGGAHGHGAEGRLDCAPRQPSDREIADEAVARRIEKIDAPRRTAGRDQRSADASGPRGRDPAPTPSATTSRRSSSAAPKAWARLSNGSGRSLSRRTRRTRARICPSRDRTYRKRGAPSTGLRHGRAQPALPAHGPLTIDAGGCSRQWRCRAGGGELEQVTPLPNLSMVFLFAVVACATAFRHVVRASRRRLLSFFAYNFFFIDAALHLHNRRAARAVLAVDIPGGRCRDRWSCRAVARTGRAATRERAKATQTLYDFSRKLSGAAKPGRRAVAARQPMRPRSKGRSIVLLDRTADDLSASPVGWPPDDQLSTSDWAAARWAH